MTTAIAATKATPHRVGVLRLLVTGALTAAVLFLGCWLGTFLPFSSPTHAYIGLFTTAPVQSTVALWVGLCWSLIFGALAGAVFAFLYNATAGLDRK